VNRGILDVGVKSKGDNGKIKKEIRLKSFKNFGMLETGKPQALFLVG